MASRRTAASNGELGDAVGDAVGRGSGRRSGATPRPGHALRAGSGRYTARDPSFLAIQVNAPYRSDVPEGNKYEFSEQVGHLLRRAYQRHVAIFQQTIPDSQLTAGQFVVLCAIEAHGPCSLSEIARATAIDQATVRGIIERLKARKLIAVSHDPNDRRKVVLLLSQAGNALIREVVPFAQDISERTMGGLNPAERVALVYLLRKMCELDEQEQPDGDSVPPTSS